MTSTKIMLPTTGIPQLTHPAAHRGYDGRNPIIEVSGTDSVSPARVLAAYSRCVILPLMHAEQSVPWAAIANARQGQIIRLGE